MKMRDKMKILSEYREGNRNAQVYENSKGKFTVTCQLDGTATQAEFYTEFEAECAAENFVLAVDDEKIILKPRGGVL